MMTFEKHPAPWTTAQYTPTFSFTHVRDANDKEVCQCKDAETAAMLVAEMNTVWQAEYSDQVQTADFIMGGF